MKAERNKTIDFLPEDAPEYLTRCLRVTEDVPLDTVCGRTICGDTFAVAPHLPRGFADLLIVDPPYNLTKDFSGGGFRRTTDANYAAFTRAWIELLLPLLKPDASVYVCCDWRSSPIVGLTLKEYFRLQNRITWQREKGRGAQRNWKNGMEDIWFATRTDDYTFHIDAVKVRRRVRAPYRTDGQPKDWEETPDGRFRNTCPSNFWDDISVPYWSMPENTAHPTQKPEKLLAKLILASSDPGGIVLDPFAGSGSTAVTAKKLGRRFVAIERSEQYCAWAEKRLELAETTPAIQGYAGRRFCLSKVCRFLTSVQNSVTTETACATIEKEAIHMKRGYLYIAVTTLLFSSMEVALKLISGQFNPIQLNFSRFVVGGLVLIPFAVRELKKRGLKLDGKALGSFALLGLMGIAVSMSLYQLSVTRIQASVVGVLFSSNPVFVTLFAFLLLHETISKNQVAGLVLDVAGIVLIIQPWHLRLDALGVVYVLLATLLFALYGVCGKRQCARFGGLVVTCFGFLFGAAEMIALAGLTHIPSLAASLTAAGLDTFASIPFFTGYTLANLPIVLFIYIGVTGIGFTCYFLSMEVTSAQTTSLVFFFKPALAPLLAFLVLHEAIPGNMLAGIACILCGSLVSILPGLLAQRKSALPVTEGTTREKIEV